jgi:chromosome partitioning protein
MKTWAFCSQKGGVGKTSLSIHIAVYAASLGERVVIIDLDPQETAKAWHSRRGEDSTPPMVIAALPENLGKVLEAAETLGMTLVIIDTAGKIDSVALTVIKRADLIIVPTVPNFLDINALRGTADLLKRGGKLDSAICVINRLYTKNKAADFKSAEMQASALGIRVAPTACGDRRSYVHAIEEGKGITEYRPQDREAVKEVQDLWKQLFPTKPAAAAKKGARA